MAVRLRGIDAAGLPWRLYRFTEGAVVVVTGVGAVATAVDVGTGAVVGGLVLALSCTRTWSRLGLGLDHRSLPLAAG